MIERLDVSVRGRPAPQGSKHRGAHGQMREASPYLPAWRAAVKRAVYGQYKALGVEAAELPLLRGPVAFGATFYLPPGRRPDAIGGPDLDKLLRAVWDALTAARVWEDDGRVVEIDWLCKQLAPDGEGPGVDLSVRLLGTAGPQREGESDV